MSRWLAGAFDPAGRLDPALPARALGADAGGELSDPPLRLAFSGPPLPRGGPFCLLDGQLDNAAEIARELAGDRDAPVSSPESLLAAAYRRWGPAMLERLRGDFALVVWDPERRQGLIARDQLGVRPLFLHEGGGVLRFASEVRLLLALLPTRPAPDPAGVAHWLAVSSRPGMQTLYVGVRRLGPGEALVLERGGVRPWRYWAPRFEQPIAASPPQLAERVREVLERAVRRRISADGRTAVLMSGGLDSSAVAALGARVTGGELMACSASFPDHPAADESELIASLRESLGLHGIAAEVRAGGLLASALEYQAAWQMPLLGWGDFWTLELMRAAAAGEARVVLGGDGGDELFGTRHLLLADRIRAGRLGQAIALAGELPGAGPHVPRRQVASMIATAGFAGALPYRPHSAVRSLRARLEGPRWLRRRTRRELVASDDPLAWKRLDGPRWWANVAHGVTRGIEQMGAFEHLRRRAVLAGVEARHPILDLDVVELGLRQPPRATLDRRFNRPVLRESMASLLPDEVRLRPAKARFESLIVSCLTGADGSTVRRLLLDPKAELRAYVDQERMRRELFGADDPLGGDPFRWMWHVWRLTTAELWLRGQSLAAGELRLDPPPSTARVSVGAAGAYTLFPS